MKRQPFVAYRRSHRQFSYFHPVFFVYLLCKGVHYSPFLQVISGIQNISKFVFFLQSDFCPVLEFSLCSLLDTDHEALCVLRCHASGSSFDKHLPHGGMFLSKVRSISDEEKTSRSKQDPGWNRECKNAEQPTENQNRSSGQRRLLGKIQQLKMRSANFPPEQELTFFFSLK